MERKNWIKPMTLVQKFEANEAVALCWEVACKNDTYYDGLAWNTKKDSNAPRDEWHFWKHSESINGEFIPFEHSDCNTASNNLFAEDNGNIIFKGEVAHDVRGGFEGWVDVDGSESITPKDRIYWYSQKKVGLIWYTWNHWGEVSAVNIDHPNRS